MNAPRALFLALLVPTLLTTGCKKKVVEEVVDDGGDVPPPSVELQVAGIDPSYGPAGEAFPAEVLGSAFELGARVTFNGTPAEQVSWRDSTTLAVVVPPLEAGYYDVSVIAPNGTKATLRKGLTITEGKRAGTGCGSLTVHFALDSSALESAERDSLERLATCLKAGNTPLRVEGHCDERGTTDYNIALGQRRAESVARYMQGLGLPSSRMEVVSYGEERPVDPGHDESAWSQNRRAELIPRE